MTNDMISRTLESNVPSLCPSGLQTLPSMDQLLRNHTIASTILAPCDGWPGDTNNKNIGKHKQVSMPVFKVTARWAQVLRGTNSLGSA